MKSFNRKKEEDIFYFFVQNIDCEYTLEPPRRGGSNQYPQSMFWSKIRKIGIPLQTPFFYIKERCLRRCSLHGHAVFLMTFGKDGCFGNAVRRSMTVHTLGVLNAQFDKVHRAIWIYCII